MKHILTVCELNFARSITTEYLLKKRAEKENLEIIVESAGLFSKAVKRDIFENFFYYLTYLPYLSNKRLSKEKADKADLILVMDWYMITEMINKYKQAEEKLICLDVPRTYRIPYSPKLINLIEERLNEIKTFLY